VLLKAMMRASSAIITSSALFCLDRFTPATQLFIHYVHSQFFWVFSLLKFAVKVSVPIGAHIHHRPCQRAPGILSGTAGVTITCLDVLHPILAKSFIATLVLDLISIVV
jgi:hypothetical protein